MDRVAPARAALSGALLAVNPQAALAVRRRALAQGTVSEGMHVQVRNQPPFALDALQAALMAALESPRTGSEVLDAVGAVTGALPDDVLGAIEALLAAEVLYAPRQGRRM